MKKAIFSLLLITVTYLVQAQVMLQVNELNGHAVFKLNSEKKGKELSYDEILGSPYLNKNFSLAKINKDIPQIYVRYNSFRDDVEFKKDGEVLVLPKQFQFSRIEFSSPKETLVLLETNDNLSGYFFEILNGKFSLYKKIKTTFNDFVPAANSFSEEKPANFKIQNPIYYIKTNKGVIKIPKNTKDFLEQFPDNKDITQNFIKSNKIKFNKEEDLIKLVNFLNK